MKNLLLAVATFGLALAAFGQGSVFIDNTFAAGGVRLEIPGTYYSGTFGLEVWMKNGSTPDIFINSLNGTINENMGLAYDALSYDGFTLQKTFTGQPMVNG